MRRTSKAKPPNGRRIVGPSDSAMITRRNAKMLEEKRQAEMAKAEEELKNGA